jgi:hypothetical protein
MRAELQVYGLRDSQLGNLCLAGQGVSRRRMRFEVQQSDTRRDRELLVTATPILYDNEALTLLGLEDITEVSMLKSLLPICMHCKKIRDDQATNSYTRFHAWWVAKRKELPH